MIMSLSSRDERRLTMALKTLAEFWPHLVLPRTGDKPLPGIVMYRDLEGAIQVRAALDEDIKGKTS
jgi:hypothetical protein